MTRAEFLNSFPEFVKVSTSLIDAKLAEAASEVDPLTWDYRADTGIGYLTAHKLSVAPMGAAARLVNDASKTTYLAEFDRLKRLVAVGLRST